MKFASAALAVLAGASALAATPAMASVVTAEANLARSEGDWGGELAVGVPVVQDGGFEITPGVGLFFHDRDHPNYYHDNGDCFSKQSGNQVSGGKCDNSGTTIFAKLEATYRLPMSLAVGVGARLTGDNLRPYGTVSMPVFPHLNLKGNVGDHYLAAGLQARF
ncbi:hypothetical protein EDF56_103476 [Novosphingobium sp. PhB165]|uniref:hypothetical protein n=1 Tax=Novosphingobium sp. PhB165 TaxID=2485105 RepID=UPI00105198BA|nr:hypothetical protein [Novosphingobium sp. PhB165]TCM19831.1 hypothetical protein EDF56_103476 [Novosphingobium sp. PhB165]